MVKAVPGRGVAIAKALEGREPAGRQVWLTRPMERKGMWLEDRGKVLLRSSVRSLRWTEFTGGGGTEERCELDLVLPSSLWLLFGQGAGGGRDRSVKRPLHWAWGGAGGLDKRVGRECQLLGVFSRWSPWDLLLSGCGVCGGGQSEEARFFLPVVLLFSCSVVSDSLRPHGLHASLSFSISWSRST